MSDPIPATLPDFLSDETLPAQIANRLRRDILRGKLVPGASITERDSATEMGVSRTPMREAIRILALEGLIELRPARSPIVANPSIKEIIDDIEVLMAVEDLAAQLACDRATDADLECIAQINQQVADVFDTIDPLDVFEVDMSFHSAIAAAAHNQQLAAIHRTFLARLWRARFVAVFKNRNRARVTEQHSNIYKAIRNKDKAAARVAVDKHLVDLPREITEVIAAEQTAAKAAAAAPARTRRNAAQ